MKKLDNKGWGLSDYLIIVVVIIIALTLASVLLLKLTNNLKENVNQNDDTNITESIDNNNNTEKNDTSDEAINYKELEQNLNTIGEKYVEVHYNGTIGNGTTIVDNQHILELDSQIEKELSKDNCKAYVVIIKDDTSISYTPYLSCDNYKTDGYLEIYN